MDIEVVTIGTELLLGLTVDTNAATIGTTLAAQGVRVRRRATVGDDARAIEEAVREGLARTGAVLTTGGLGPTRDDITKHVVARIFGRSLHWDEAVWEQLLQRFRRLGREPSPANRCQAEVPDGAVVLPNRWGTAPGLWVEGELGLVILLPGVPREMSRLLEHEVVPRLASRGTGRVIRSRMVRTTGIPESSLAARLGEIEAELEPLSLAYLPGVDGVDLRLTAWGLPPEEADQRLNAGVERLTALAQPQAYGTDDDDLAELLLAELRRTGRRLATAESCTGGLLGGRITAIPGSSDVYVGGVVTYANAMKEGLIGVSAALLTTEGAVSEAVAQAMLDGLLARTGADAGIAITGIAGPGGGSLDKPVGTVWFAWGVGELRQATRVVFAGNRAEIRARAVQHGLYRLWLDAREAAPGLNLSAGHEPKGQS